jgi:hypothetical protein
MPASRIPFAMTCGLCLTVLVACSAESGSDPAATGAVLGGSAADVAVADGTVFSEQEKRAARMLSMASGGSVETASSPYQQALRCRTAIETVGARFREAGAQGETQSRAIAQATAILEQRLRAQAVLEKKSDAAIRRDLEQAVQAVQAVDDLPAQGQLLIACLQQPQ